MAITLTPELKKEYETLFTTSVIKPDKQASVVKLVGTITANRARYEAVETLTSVPWYVIAAIHSLEGSLNFKTHLHNGDPLTAKTTHVPKNRPPVGSPPIHVGRQRNGCSDIRQSNRHQNLESGDDLVQAGRLQRIRLSNQTS